MKPRNMLAGVAIVLSLGACAGPTATPGRFDLVEYDIVGPSQLEAGTDSVVVTNSGELPHTLVITDDSGQVIEATSLISPGASLELSLGLEAGRYNFTCRIVTENAEGDLVDHYEEGMNRTVSVNS